MSRTKRNRVEKYQRKWPYVRQDVFIAESFLKKYGLSWGCNLSQNRVRYFFAENSLEIYRSRSLARPLSENPFLVIDWERQPLELGSKKEISRFESDSGSVHLRTGPLKKQDHRSRRAKSKQELARMLRDENYEGDFGWKNDRFFDPYW